MSVDQLPPGRASTHQRGAQLVRYDEYIDKQIETTRRMVKTVDVMTALLLMAAGTLGFLLAAAIVEHWLVPGGFNLGMRLFLFVALAGGLLYIAVRRLWPLVAGSINPAYAAHTIEQDNPSLKNSLLNLLLFRQHRDDVTDAVYETLEEQAARRLTRVPVDSAVDRTQLLRLGYVLVAIVAAVALYKIFSPKDPFITAERVLMPWARIVPPSRVSIENVEPGAVTLARGEVLTISADVRGIGDDDPVVIKYTTADGQAVDRPAPMRPSSAGLRFTGQLPPISDGTKAGIAQNLRYRIEAGDARSLEYAVAVVAAPTITVERIDYDYPEYTGYVDHSVERLGDIRAIEGTRVTIHARANGPIEEAAIDFEADGRRDIHLEATGSDARATFTLELREDRQTPQHTSYVLRFTGIDGRPNRDPVKFPIDVTPDRAPEVGITAPAEKTRDVRLDETVAIEVDAIDSDFGLADVRVHGESAGKPVLDEKLLTQEHTGRFRGRLLFTPIEHNLKPGDVVRYWVAARDNRTPTANEVASDSQTLRILGGRPGERQPNQNGQRDQRDQQQNNDPSQDGEQQPGEGGQSGAQGADSSEGSEQGESSAGESASADGNSDQQGDQNSENQSGESNGGKSSGSENNSDESKPGNESTGEGQSPSAAQNKPGNQQQQPGESSETGESGERSKQNSSQQPGSSHSDGDQNSVNQSENHPGANRQPGQQGSEPKSGSDSKPVSPEGDNDGEAFERIQDFLNREGQLPNEEQDQQKDSPSESGEPASAGGENTPNSEKNNPNESSNSESGEPNDTDPNSEQQGEQQPGTDANADSQAGKSQEKTSDRSQPNGDSQSPAGQHTTSEGESGAGQEPQEGQGSPESQQQNEQPGEWQQKPSGNKQSDQQGDQQEAPSGGRGDRKNDSQGNEGGDRSGGGEEGAGQKSEREGTGSSGQNQSADDGAGESSEQGTGENSSNAGEDATSNERTGQPGANEKGAGSSQRESQTKEPGSTEEQPAQGEPASAGGNQSPSSNSEANGEECENPTASPDTSTGEKPNPGNQPGNSNNADGAGRVPDGVIQPSNSSGTAPEADAANLEYARKQTDLVLETLDEQMKRQKVDKRLLDKLGWTEADLKRFLDRWRQLKEAAARDDSPVADEAQRELDDALRSLGLRRGQLQQAKVSDDTNRDLRQGYRGAIPLEYQERLRAYNQGVSRAQQSDE